MENVSVKEELDKRWHWLLAEFAVIALGVFSALFVDAWLNDREDARISVVYLERLQGDLELDIQQLEERIKYHQYILEEGRLVLAAFRGEVKLGDTELLKSAFIAAEEFNWQAVSSTYRDLESTGNLRLIGNLNLRGGLARYYNASFERQAVWRLPVPYRQRARGIIPERFQEAMHRECYRLDNFVREQVRGSTECKLNIKDIDITGPAKRIIEDHDLEDLLRYRMSQVRVGIQLFRTQIVMAQQLLTKFTVQ